jgi:pimeloyl-ACP methyl ester carboxylesterase
MSPLAEGAGVELSYTEQGSGPPVLLVHGMASGAQDLAAVADALAGQARVVSYDRRGYGASGAPEPYTGTTVMEQAQDAAELLAALGIGEAVIAGDGFGALVALDLLHRHPGLARAAVLADPPLLAFVPAANERLGAQRQRVDEALRERGAEAGVEAWLGGRVQGESLQRARASYRGFYADFAGLASWPATRGDLRALAQPTVVLTSPATAPAIRAAAERLVELLPAVTRADDGDLAAATRLLLRRG